MCSGILSVNRGTVGGGGVTTIGSDNLSWLTAMWLTTRIWEFHNHGKRRNFGGHVLIEDHATVGAFSAVHQFCRVGTHAFIGGSRSSRETPCPTSRPWRPQPG